MRKLAIEVLEKRELLAVTLSLSGTESITVSDADQVAVIEQPIVGSLALDSSRNVLEYSADTVLTYSLDAAAESLEMSINAATGEFSWTPGEELGGGTYDATVTVSDGSLSDSETISITVAEVNVAPVLDPIGDKTVDEQDTLSFTATATDQDLSMDTFAYRPAGSEEIVSVDVDWWREAYALENARAKSRARSAMILPLG